MGIGGRKYIPEDRLLSKEDFLKSIPLVNHKEVIEKINSIKSYAQEFNAFEGEFLTELLRKATYFKETFRMSNKEKIKLEELYNRHVLGMQIEEKIKPDDQVKDMRKIKVYCRANLITLGGEIHFNDLGRIVRSCYITEQRARFILGLLKTTVMVEDIVL